ncbi:hypothetical protein [Flavobacterium chungangense]|uniref:Uncharacterized protein n=1 Tax=Flavobacterium chungangense TaxID=554283 RepID=A0A6V6Z5D5_9FLAO|nr:hypothetical protein [Flavobacterium chungangense]CAD0006142.1 hypothetical protein FLACHUCJ7_02715 [Flavobacterium chungangense]
MKKNIVLFSLFVLPIVAYLFFASGVNSFTTLPVITPKIADFGNWKSLDNKKVSLNKKITVLGFSGSDILSNRGNYFNLNEKIYKRYYGFEDLQFVIVCPIGKEKDAQKVVDALKPFTDVKGWNFIFAPPAQIEAFYNQLHLKGKLDQNLGTPNVFIVDKERNLRGRKGDNKDKKEEYKEGYSTFHPSELSNEMLDDFKIILYEYRAALKKNHNATKQL